MTRKIVPVRTEKTVKEFVDELHQESSLGEIAAVINISVFGSGLVRGSLVGEASRDLLENEIGRLLDLVRSLKDESWTNL
ncbi:hypothetical protein [Methylobacterium nigriterrae]|uniref:hypothetical protein n=1 Tax=Methylobacterium nigriterrae TaxID=3127512 RepID=UPI003014009F